MAKIFVSYKRIDEENVSKIVNRIEIALNEKCWIDNEGVESASQFKNVIIRAINDCEIMLFMYSKTHLKIDYEKDWTMRELNFAMKKNKRIVFINIDKSPLADAFEFDFGTQQQVDGTSEQSISCLLRDLKRWLKITEPITTLSQPAKKSDKTTFIVNGVSFDMVHVEGGTFTMGATREQESDAWSDEKPTHQVTLSDYYIGKYEVTQELWEAVMGKNPSYFKGSARPVENVSWDDCQAFISKLNLLLSSQLEGKHFALPTEAQWEYAARGGKKCLGYKYAGGNSISSVAWYIVNSYDKGSNHPDYGTHAVGTKSPNELGLYDMSGNVWEWCQDWNGNYCSSSQTNPSGAATGVGRMYRGGSWNFSARFCRVSHRYYYAPSRRGNALGFRLVLLP